MSARGLRASAVLSEARYLGVDIADLVAAAGPTDLPAVAEWVAKIDTTFTPATARTYRSYWKLTTRMLGEWRLAEFTTVDLGAPCHGHAPTHVRQTVGSLLTGLAGEPRATLV